MKKILSFILSLCMMLSLSAPAFATSEKLEEYVVITPLEQVENDGTFVPVIQQKNTDEFNAEEKALQITQVYGDYLRVYPVYELNGKYVYPKNCYRQYKGSLSATYIRQSITYETQQEMKQYVIDLGYNPVGWYIEAALCINAKQPKYIDYKIMDHNGISSLKRVNASFTGSTEFTCMGLYPEDTSKKYTYGITGTAYYVGYGMLTTSQMSIELSAQFAPSK